MLCAPFTRLEALGWQELRCEKQGNTFLAVIGKELTMAIESIVALGLTTAFLVGLAWYVSRHRSDDENKHERGGLAATQSVPL